MINEKPTVPRATRCPCEGESSPGFQEKGLSGDNGESLTGNGLPVAPDLIFICDWPVHYPI